MKTLQFFLSFALLALFVPAASSAVILGDGDGGAIGLFAGNILAFIQSYVIPFILSIGFLFFVWGMFLYFIKGGHSDEAQESGKSLMTYAIAGFVIILSFWGIINLISGGIGLNNDDGIDTPDATPGTVPTGDVDEGRR